MAPTPTFSGALQPKKKSELQQLAAALDIDSTGTKDDLQSRIKKHLDNNQSELEDDPVFSGLFGRRKRSVQPVSRVESRKAVVVLNPVRESTPVDNRDVSAYLKSNPFSPGTPSSLPPLPESADVSMEVVRADRSIIDHLPLSRPDVSLVVQRIKESEENARRSANEGLIAFRGFLSNSRNIWSLTAVFELLFILYTIIPWQTYNLNLGRTTFALPYPPSYTLSYPGFIPTLTHWFIPTLVLPALLGTLISFSPATPTPSPTRAIPFDPLTASIIRLALQFAYNPATPPTPGPGVGPLYAQDPLGVRLRVLNAAVGLAFSFAEAIKGAPAVWAKELLARKDDEADSEDVLVPGRRALTTEETVVELE
ncbi:SAP domain-containing protein [Mycena venus]|uniref:SAP domain-containing protein n=1 Tax=Mycena venus TaxID=2733690 RepID=A0A8H6YD42_9AGAR|nr:SAP domain-containing protein [Mycena venus]